MNILNYFFIGTVFVFIVELLLNIKSIKNHPKMKNASWGWFERISTVSVWPLAFTIFTIAFIKTFFKK
jgi:hypothetical protein